MINGLQVVAHMPLFKIKSPGNVNAFNEFFSEISSFKIVETEKVTSDLLYYPEMDAMSLNFQNAGYETYMVVPNLGNMLYIMLIHFALVIPHFILFIVARLISKVNRLKSKVANYVYWNGSIRFFMEGYFDFVMFSLVNYKMIGWEIMSEDFWAVSMSNVLACALLFFSLALPIVFIIFYSYNLKKW